MKLHLTITTIALGTEWLRAYVYEYTTLHLTITTIALGTLLLVACGSTPPTNTPPAPVFNLPTDETGNSSIANPASEKCIELGGEVRLEKRGDGGEFGVCWFEDARQCEEWALMRGECPAGGLKVTGYGPQGRYCVITGGQYTDLGGDITTEKGLCTLPNGQQCDGADYFNGICTPAAYP